MKERELIKIIQSIACRDNSQELLCGIGDDCAVIRKNTDTVLLYSMDTLVESVHFEREWHPPELLGRKAVSVNVSDIAAMGGQPLYCLFSFGLPPDFDDDWAVHVSRGIVEGCTRYGCLLIGGDTVSSPKGVSLTITVIGEGKTDQVLYRHGAKTGDTILVSGSLGLAAGGLDLFKKGLGKQRQFERLFRAHLDPLAKVELGKLLAESGLVHAMMDISDGLATDLAHLCARSQLGAHIHSNQLPLESILSQAAETLGQDPLQWLIRGGDDYELLLTAPEGAVKKLQDLVANTGNILYPIGNTVESSDIELVLEDTGTTVSVGYSGFDHFISS